MSVRKYLSFIHRWVGLPVAILFLITFLSGFILALDEMVERFQTVDTSLSDAERVFNSLTSQEKGRKLNALLTGYQTAQSVLLPSEFKPYWLVRVKREEYRFHPLTLNSLDVPEVGGFVAWVLNLHKHYLLGRDGLFSLSGKYYVAWVGLFSLLLSLVGVCLWWRLRKSFMVKKLLPRESRRHAFYYSHMHLGVVVLMAVIGFSLTGAGMAYRDVARGLMVETHADLLAEKPEGQLVDDGELNGWSKRFYLAENAFDNAQVVSVRLPRTDSDLVEIRLLSDHGLGLPINAAMFDRSGMLAIRDVESMPLMEWFYYAMTALHTGRDLPIYYVLVLCLFSVLSVVMLVSSVLSFIKKKPKKRAGYMAAAFIRLRAIK